MSFKQLIQSINEGDVITFREYYLDRHDRVKLSYSIDNGVVQAVFQAGQKLNIETLVQYYGEGLEETDYLQLSCVAFPRVVIGLGINQQGETDVKIVQLNEDFYNMGLQQVELTKGLSGDLVEPNYLLFHKDW